MKTASWLALRELFSRKARLFTSVALVAVAVALCVTTELLSRAREVALAAEIDQIGPAIQLIPLDVSQTDLTQLDLRGKLLEPRLKADVQARFSHWIRTLEGRLVVSENVDGIRMPVIGIETRTIDENGVELGAVAATRLEKQVGDTIRLREVQLRVAAILPTAGTAEDLALVISRERLKLVTRSSGDLNELRMFLLPGRDAKVLGGLLRDRYAGTRVVINDRGKVADQESADTLRKHRFVLYAITSTIVAVSLLIGAFLNARERTNEMSTLIAIGGTRMTVFHTLTLRALIVSFLGGVCGYVLGVSVALAQGIGGAFLLLGSWDLLIFATLATATLGILAAGPMLLSLLDRCTA